MFAWLLGILSMTGDIAVLYSYIYAYTLINDKVYIFRGDHLTYLLDALIVVTYYKLLIHSC